MAAGCDGTDIVHSHTWYANLAGHTAKLLYGVPHVVTTHSLEPLRPWKAEQLGGGYALSSFCERTAIEGADAIIAVSGGHEAGRADRVPERRSGPDPGGLQRHRHRAVRAGPRHRRDRAPRHRPGPAQRGLRRPDHPAEGPAVPAAGLPRPAARDADRAARGRARHDGDRRRGRGPGDRAAHARDARRDLGAGDAAQARGRAGADRTRRCSSARRSTSRWASSTWRRWPARRPWSRPRPAASRRSSRTARPACWSRSSRSRTARAPRSTRTASWRTWRRR